MSKGNTDIGSWRCACGAISERHLSFCPRCGQFGSYYPIVRPPFDPGPLPAKILSGMEMIRKARHPMKLGGSWADILPEGLLCPFMLVLWGPPGSGKSTLAIRLADSWEQPSLYISYEMGLGQTLAALVARLEATRPDFGLIQTWEELLEARAKYDLVVIDTLQQSAIAPANWRSLVDRGMNLLLLSQVNTEGAVRGGLAASHLADVSIELPSFGEFKVLKNRFGRLAEGRL